MPHFLFQPDPIDEVKFMPVSIDIHRGIVNIVDEEIHHDFELNNTECVVVGKDRKEVLASLQEGFAQHTKGTANSRRRTSQRCLMRQGRRGKGCRGLS